MKVWSSLSKWWPDPDSILPTSTANAKSIAFGLLLSSDQLPTRPLSKFPCQTFKNNQLWRSMKARGSRSRIRQAGAGHIHNRCNAVLIRLYICEWYGGWDRPFSMISDALHQDRGWRKTSMTSVEPELVWHVRSERHYRMSIMTVILHNGMT